MAQLRSQNKGSDLPWVFFGLQGRVSRRVYWLATLFLIAIDSAVFAQIFGLERASYHAAAQAVWPFLVLLTLFCNIAVAVKRLHDCGYTGLFALSLLVPLVNLAFSIWIGLLPGTPGANRFAPYADARPP